MTHACCNRCRIRFLPAAAAYLPACPSCGEPPQPLAKLADAVGYRLFRISKDLGELPEALSVSTPVPDPRGGLLPPARRDRGN